jgi:ribosomal protein S27E
MEKFTIVVSGKSCLGDIERNRERAKEENRCKICGQVKTPNHHTVWQKPTPNGAFSKVTCYDVTPNGETKIIYEKELKPNADR